MMHHIQKNLLGGGELSIGWRGMSRRALLGSIVTYVRAARGSVTRARLRQRLTGHIAPVRVGVRVSVRVVVVVV